MVKQLYTKQSLLILVDSYKVNYTDNLSEINNKDCKKCMERKKIRSECEFIGLKNNRLNYKCKNAMKHLLNQ